MDCETLCRFIAECPNQSSAAYAYACAMQEKHGTPGGLNDVEFWRPVNEAILKRWPKGLQRVKAAAWRIVS